MAMFLAGCCG